MSWRIIVEIEWPKETDLERLLAEMVEPLDRDNVVVLGVSLERVPEL